MGENRHIRHVLELTVLAVIFIAVAIEHEVVAGMSIKELTFVGVAVVLGLGLGAAILSWIYSQPEQLLGNMRVAFEEFKGDSIQLNSEFKSLLTQTLEKQPFVSEDVLAIIEERADTIWVVTTDLRNDVMPGKIRDSVAANLKKGKRYTYFLPAPTNSNFPNAAQHEKAYKDWAIYKYYASQITFIHLPHDTLFLFREVVIYNPFVNTNTNAEYDTRAKGFTYFDTSLESRDKLMQIPETYLEFLKGQLYRYTQDIGLMTEVERLFKELEGRLEKDDIVYLAKLIGKRNIEDSTQFIGVVESVRNRDSAAADLLSNTLSRYVA